MRIALGDVNTVASTIQKIEGWYPPGTPGYPQGSLSYRNNNPGNLTFANQPGATPVTVCNPTCITFADFDTVGDGEAALDNQLQLMAGRGETIQEAINIYAPAAGGNNPTSYAAQIAAATGLTVNDPLSAAIGSGTPAVAVAPDSSSGDTSDTSDGGSWLDSLSSAWSSVAANLSLDPTTLAAVAAVAGLGLVLVMQEAAD